MESTEAGIHGGWNPRRLESTEAGIHGGWNPRRLESTEAGIHGGRDPRNSQTGQVPRDLETGKLLGEDGSSQTACVIENLRKVLTAASATLDDLVAVNIYLQNSGGRDAFNDVYRRELSPPHPTRTTVGAELRGILLEISAVAVCRDG